MTWRCDAGVLFRLDDDPSGVVLLSQRIKDAVIIDAAITGYGKNAGQDGLKETAVAILQSSKNRLANILAVYMPDTITVFDSELHRIRAGKSCMAGVQ